MEATIIPATKELRLLVDYLPLPKLIAGKYDMVDENITAENFFWSQTGRGEILISLFRLAPLRRYISDEEIISDLIKFGYELPILPELVATNGSCPTLQKEFSLIVLNKSTQLSTSSFIDNNGAQRLITYPLKHYYLPEKYGFMGVKRLG